MAMWDLNCQSNPSSADDKELAPILHVKGDARVFERALFAPKDQNNNGLYFFGRHGGIG